MSTENNKSIIKVAALVLTVFASCQSDLVQAAAGCTFPSSPDASAPSWVCGKPMDGIGVSASGSEKIENNEVDFAQESAIASAHKKLASQMIVHVSGAMDKYLSSTGNGKKVSMEKINKSVTHEVTEANISGSKLVDSVTAPDGTIYVLVGIDVKETQKQAEQIINSSLNNDESLWQEFKANKSKEELAKAISAGK